MPGRYLRRSMKQKCCPESSSLRDQSLNRSIQKLRSYPLFSHQSPRPTPFVIHQQVLLSKRLLNMSESISHNHYTVCGPIYIYSILAFSLIFYHSLPSFLHFPEFSLFKKLSMPFCFLNKVQISIISFIQRSWD